MVATSCQVGRLLDGVLTKNVVVSLLFELLSILGDELLLCDSSDAPGSIKSIVCNLSLERETLDLCKIKILHFKKLGDLFESVFNRYLCLFCNITKVFDQKRHILRKINGVFISELKSLVKLNFDNYISCNDWQLENIGKVFG